MSRRTDDFVLTDAPAAQYVDCAAPAPGLLGGQRYFTTDGASASEGTPMYVVAKEDGDWLLTASQNTPVVLGTSKAQPGHRLASPTRATLTEQVRERSLVILGCSGTTCGSVSAFTRRPSA